MQALIEEKNAAKWAPQYSSASQPRFPNLVFKCVAVRANQNHRNPSSAAYGFAPHTVSLATSNAMFRSLAVRVVIDRVDTAEDAAPVDGGLVVVLPCATAG